MPFSPEIEAARSVVFELYGRTILRFQKLEILIKSLVGQSQIRLEGDTRTNPNSPHPHATLGLATDALFKKVLLSSEYDPNAPVTDPELPEDKVSFNLRFHMPLGPEIHQAWAGRLKKLIEARNELVHHSLSRMDLDTIEGCESVRAELDTLGSQIAKESGILISLAKSQSEMAAEVIGYLLVEIERAAKDRL